MVETNSPLQEEQHEETPTTTVGNGALLDSMIRNNKQIKRDRAESINEDAETSYRRRIEDKKQELRRIQRAQQNMLDLSPTNTQTLLLAEDFKGEQFVDADLKFGIQIRNLKIEIEILSERYSFLFNKSI